MQLCSIINCPSQGPQPETVNRRRHSDQKIENVRDGGSSSGNTNERRLCINIEVNIESEDGIWYRDRESLGT